MTWPAESHVVTLVLLSLCLAILPAVRTVTSARLRQLAPPTASLEPGEASTIGRAQASGTGAQSVADRARTNPSGATRADTAGWRAGVFSVIAGSAVLATFPSVVGGLAALAVSAGCHVLLRGTSSPMENPRTERWLTAIRWPGGSLGRAAQGDPELPFAIDLLAVCLRAGMPTSSALRAVGSILSSDDHSERRAAGQAMPGAATVLAGVAAATELGSEPAKAWQGWIGHPVYGRLARALIVTGESGSAVAGRLEAVSQLLRTAGGQHAMERAQRVGVALMAPLGLCFLPAFVCLGVVPVVVGIASQVFG